MSNLRMHIIGGTGHMGNWLKLFLESQGLAVTVSGRKSKNETALKEADVVFVSVPIDIAPKIILETAKKVKKSCLLVDMSSIKTSTVKALEKTRKPSLGVHLLFGPTVTSIQNQKIVFTIVKENAKVNVLKELFENAGGEVILMAVEKHDLVMAGVQALTHFVNMSLAKTLLDYRIDLSGKVSTPVFLAQISAMSRVMTQDASLLARIQVENPIYKKVLQNLLKNQSELVELIKNHNLTSLQSEIEKIQKEIKPQAQDNKNLKGKISSSYAHIPPKSQVGFLGPEGTFSHQLAKKLASTRSTNLVPCRTIYEIFKKVEVGDIDYGLVPYENSIEGSVRETLDYLIDFNLDVKGSANLLVHQNLLSCEKDLKNISRVLSHPQGIAQSREWLSDHLPNVKIETTSSTIAGVEETKKPGVALIGPLIAANLYNLNVLAKNVESKKDNITRFLIISKSNKILQSSLAKTLLYVSVFNRVGILRDILNVFADSNINLAKLESRPSKEKNWDYCFFIEVDVTSKDDRLVQSLNILKQLCPSIKILGEI